MQTEISVKIFGVLSSLKESKISIIGYVFMCNYVKDRVDLVVR